MTKLMTLNLSEVQLKAASTALSVTANSVERKIAQLVDGPLQAINALSNIAFCRKLADRFKEGAEAISLNPDEGFALVTSLRHLNRYTLKHLGKISEGNPEMILGGLQALVIADELLQLVCEKADALAKEEEAAAASGEAEGLRKAA